MKLRVPSWENVIDRMNAKELSGGDFLLSSDGGACSRGEISVFCGSSYFTTLPIVHYLIEQIAFKDDPVLCNDILVLSSRMRESEFLKRLAFSMGGIDCCRLECKLKEKGLCSEYAMQYEDARAKIEASNLQILPNGVIDVDDLMEAIEEFDGNFPRMILIDDLLSCRCRGCGGDEHGWSMVGNRLLRLADFWSIAIIAMMPVPEAHLAYSSRYRIFGGYGSLRDYIQRACVVSIGNRVDDNSCDVRPFVFEPIFGFRRCDRFTMNYNKCVQKIFA